MLNEYQNYIALSKYARWLPSKGRRETFEETVERYFMYISERVPLADSIMGAAGSQWMGVIRQEMLNLGVMPSMRLLMTAGPAADRDNVAAFNCSYTPVGGPSTEIEVLTPEMMEAGFDKAVSVTLSSIHDFDEALYILLCGTGVGFSVERQYINDLPVVGHKLPRKIYARTKENFPGVPKNELSTFSRNTNTIHVADSKYGWASSLRILITELYNGNFDIKWDTSKVRPKGQPLKIFGGRASGPGPLIELFEYALSLFKQALGRKLNSVECNDLVCKIADIVVVGGVRRAALLSLSNPSDHRMATAKSGNWFGTNPERALANLSSCYTEKPDVGAWMEEWYTIYNSKSGERGVYNRQAAQRKAAETGRRDSTQEFGPNPCAEINLPPRSFCNLTEVVVRPDDTFNSLRRKVEYATILGTIQSTLTNFVYLRPVWRENAERERLLGVSLTGIMDHPVMSGEADKICLISGDPLDYGFRDDEDTLGDWLNDLKEVAIETNKIWANALGINQSAAITCVKPSGTVSQLVDSASGIHPRYSPYYVRTVRADKKDPLAKFMAAKGFPHEDALGKEDTTWVFSFPTKSPESVMRDDRTAIQQLEHWLTYQRHWCEHKPSCTVYIKEHEWPSVGAWVWDHFDEVSGVSFLPHDGGNYKQAPYQEISEEEYNQWLSLMPDSVAWSELGEYEQEDRTAGINEFACVGNVCEVV